MADFDVDCPECGAKVGVDLEDVAKQRTVRCRKGHTIKLEDSGGGAKKAQKSINDLNKAIRRLEK